MSIGAMTQAQVDEVLQLQIDSPNSARERMFGWIALKKSYVTEDTLRQFFNRIDNQDDGGPIEGNRHV